jgi:hypothetical protein
MSTSEKDPVVPPVVRELLQESEKVQGWVAKLPEHADEAYPEVFERVRDDYIGRLDGLADQLGQHRSDLLVSLEGRRATAESLRGDRRSHAANLEEVHLRHAVGEFSEEEWDSRRTTIEASLDKVDSLLAVEEGAVSELTAVIDSIEGHTRPVRPIRLGTRKTVESAADAEAAVDSRAGEGVAVGARSWSEVVAQRPHEAPKDGGSEDELDFLAALSRDDLKNLDPILAATLNDE